MPMFSVADTKLMNFDKIIQKLHGSMGHAIKKIYTSYNDISSG